MLFSTSDTSANNVIAGNYIGTDVTGTAALPNGTASPNNGAGVILDGTGFATGNVIGTNGDGIGDAAEGNLISGNVAERVRDRRRQHR